MHGKCVLGYSDQVKLKKNVRNPPLSMEKVSQVRGPRAGPRVMYDVLCYRYGGPNVH